MQQINTTKNTLRMGRDAPLSHATKQIVFMTLLEKKTSTAASTTAASESITKHSKTSQLNQQPAAADHNFFCQNPLQMPFLLPPHPQQPPHLTHPLKIQHCINCQCIYNQKKYMCLSKKRSEVHSFFLYVFTHARMQGSTARNSSLLMLKI